MMAHIFHYLENAGGDDNEYVVITDSEDTQDERELHKIGGYFFNKSYELEDTGTLPTDIALFPR